MIELPPARFVPRGAWAAEGYAGPMRIDALLAGSGSFARDPAKAATLAKARADHVSALAKAEEDWLEASALEETATRDS